MNSSSESESCHGESHVGSVEDSRNVNESATGADNVTHEAEDAQHQMDGARTMDSVRSGLANFRQSASRTTGQIRELLETSKALDRDLVSFLQDPQTRAVLESVEDLDDEDNALLELGEEGSTDNPKEVEALKQKTKSLKRKLRKWRKAARMALSEISPDMTAEAQGDMTPGTMKSVLQKIRQLKSLTERQTSIIMSLTGECETQKAESAEKDSLIMELLKNCNGIRPTLSSEAQQENLSNGVCNLEGMVTRHENIDYQLISAAEVEEVLNKTGIQFGSAYKIPRQIQMESRANTIDSEENNNPDLAAAERAEIQAGVRPASRGRVPASQEGTRLGVQRPTASTSTKARGVWLGVAVGAAAGLGSVLMGNLHHRQTNN